MKYFLWAMFCLLIFSQLIAYNIFSAQAQTAKEQFENSLKATAQGTGHAQLSIKAESLPTTIGNIIGIILSFLGVIFLILMIYGGFTWMTARGNEQQITKAKGIIFNAMIGLVVVLAAYAITAYFGSEIVDAIIN